MEWFPELLDVFLVVLQVLAVLFLVYGAHLAIRRTGVRPALDEPSLASTESERKVALGDTSEPRIERRQRVRRRSYWRSGLGESLARQATPPELGGDHGLAR